MRPVAKDIDEYIAGFPHGTQNVLEQMRHTIRKLAPDAEEVISYAIPTFKLERLLVSFAGYERHIGFYPGAACIAKFGKDIDRYKSAKGSVQFPLDKPLPVTLISKMVRFRMKEERDRKKTIRKQK